MTLVRELPAARELGAQRGDFEMGRLATDLAVVETARRIPHVLVVDDDPATALVVRAVLDVGVTVVGLPDVYQALDHLERERVDLLLLELFLPGASGADLLRRMVRGSRPTLVVALTHAANVSRLAPDVSVDAVLHKPPAADALRATLAAALAEASSPLPYPAV